jgi:peptidyl-tRNA hydrolase, PTH1 family
MEQTKKIINSNDHKSMETVLIAGLGNPGKEYEKTRHNAGFMSVDYFWGKFREEFGFSDWRFSKKINGDISIGKTEKKKIILFKPQTFMNLSGEAVSAAVKYHKVKLEDIIVIQDEIDLPLGEYRFSTDSSSAGHKGVQNIIDTLGAQNFTRLRIGVDNRGKLASSAGKKKIPTEKYVLGKFTSIELHTIKNIFEESSCELLKRIS